MTCFICCRIHLLVEFAYEVDCYGVAFDISSRGTIVEELLKTLEVFRQASVCKLRCLYFSLDCHIWLVGCLFLNILRFLTKDGKSVVVLDDQPKTVVQ